LSLDQQCESTEGVDMTSWKLLLSDSEITAQMLNLNDRSHRHPALTVETRPAQIRHTQHSALLIYCVNSDQTRDQTAYTISTVLLETQQSLFQQSKVCEVFI